MSSNIDHCLQFLSFIDEQAKKEKTKATMDSDLSEVEQRIRDKFHKSPRFPLIDEHFARKAYGLPPLQDLPRKDSTMNQQPINHYPVLVPGRKEPTTIDEIIEHYGTHGVERVLRAGFATEDVELQREALNLVKLLTEALCQFHHHSDDFTTGDEEVFQVVKQPESVEIPESNRYQIAYMAANGAEYLYGFDYMTLETALKVGHELTLGKREISAVTFRVIPPTK